MRESTSGVIEKHIFVNEASRIADRRIEDMGVLYQNRIVGDLKR